MKTTLPLDEIEQLRQLLIASYDTEKQQFTAEKDGCIDAVLEILIMAYVFGTNNANEQLGTKIEPSETAAKKAILREYDGKNFAERVAEYFDGADIESIVRVADTDAHRVFCDAQYNTALAAKAKYKTWVTMRDDKVRETHDYIQGLTVSMDERFYTYDGDSALYPGGFESASNNVNCRCALKFS